MICAQPAQRAGQGFFSSRPVRVYKKILSEEVSTSADDVVIKLPDTPTKIRRIKGYDEEGKGWRIFEAPLSEKRKARFDSFTVVGNEITIKQKLRTYVEHSNVEKFPKLLFRVQYYTNSTYDPTYSV